MSDIRDSIGFTRVFDIDVIFLWEVATNNKRLPSLTSSILQIPFVKIWSKSIHQITSYSVWKKPTSEFFAKMEKSEFRVLIINFLLIKPYQKARPSSINIIRTLLRRMEWFRSGLPNFVVVVRAQKPYQVQVVQMRSLHNKWSIKSMILFWMTRKWECMDRNLMVESTIFDGKPEPLGISVDFITSISNALEKSFKLRVCQCTRIAGWYKSIFRQNFLRDIVFKRHTFCQKSTGNWSIKHKLFIIHPNLFYRLQSRPPSEIIHLCQRIIQSSKHFLNAFFDAWIDFSSHRKFSFMFSNNWKRVPRSGNLSFGKKKKPYVKFLARNSFTMIASWNGALSWCKIHKTIV